MNLLNLFDRHRKNTVVIVQCRLSSTRLPRKALLKLGGKTVLEWTLAAMKKVKADKYYLATDTGSADELESIAKKSGWNFFAGSRDDVLDRFCKVIELSKADVVVRATADNPFLFYEAAQELLDAFLAKNAGGSVDYMTWTGLPHGSGVEVFNAHSLITAAAQTVLPYDHEHVGPALYNHTENFTCEFVPAPEKFAFPSLRSTIDVWGDYRRAQALVHVVSGSAAVKTPYTAEQIIAGLQTDSVRYPLLLVPSTERGRGTGHLRRCLDIACRTGADIYIPDDASLKQTQPLVNTADGLCDYQIVKDLSRSGAYNLAVLDLFRTDKSVLSKIDCPVASLDDGGDVSNDIDYLLDIIPSVGLDRKANLTDPDFIQLPENKRAVTSSEDPQGAFSKALVVFGGEDPAGLTLPVSLALAKCGLAVTAVAGSEASVEKLRQQIPENLVSNITVVPPVENLREKLSSWDLVVSHYGFTAFEAAGANCAVVLAGTTPLHEQLAKKYGFVCLSPAEVGESAFKELLQHPEHLYKKIEEKKSGGGRSLSDYIVELSKGKSLCCPVCQKKMAVKDTLVARTPARTFRRCKTCGMLYMSWTVQAEQTEYNHSYFYEDYEKQYGKTYEDDFASIKAQCVRRMSVIDMMYRKRHSAVSPSVLDIGCALGPFLDAANDSGWQVFGVDVSQDAVNYVKEKLKFPAVCTAFPENDISSAFGVEQFDAVTMWYVIEHFQNLDSVLAAVSKLVKKGGMFAFSTPSASGVSAKYNTQTFFEQSPSDHYTLWEPGRADAILKRYGFEVVRTVSTGIHPERFPFAVKKGLKKGSLGFKALGAVSRLCKLGDTFEVYCRKVSD